MTLARVPADTGSALRANDAEPASMRCGVAGVGDPEQVSRYGRQVHVPGDFTDKLKAREHSSVVFNHDPGDLRARPHRMKIQRAVWRAPGARNRRGRSDS